MTDELEILTRMGLGESGVLRIETNDEKIVALFPQGVTCYVDGDGDFILTQKTRGRRPHFRAYPNGTHHVSIQLSASDMKRVDPFRLDEPSSVEIDDTDEVTLSPPLHIRPPKGSSGHTRTDLGRSSNPISRITRNGASVDMDFKSFDPRAFKRLLELVTEYAEHFDLTLYLDDEGELHARI